MPLETPDIDIILARLIDAYQDRRPGSRLTPVAELVLTILSQNTSDTNSRRAFAALVEVFPEWEILAAADPRAIAEAIRSGGLADVKARYIKLALAALHDKTRTYDMDFLKSMGTSQARDWLMKLPGVGMKTASCVLLFSLGMPAFPVDTHVFRVAGRLGLIDSKKGVNAAHIKLESLVKPDDIYRCHILFIEHGRRTCKAQRPLCTGCILHDVCPHFPALM